MEVLAGIEILFKAASAAGIIFKASQSMYYHIKKVKNPQELMNDCKGLFGAVDKKFDGISHGIEQLSDKMEHLGHITTSGFDQLSGRVEGLANTTTSRLDQLSGRVEGLANATTSRLDQLNGRVEGLAQITASGFERVSEAFSQVIVL
jgi:hypothetical protein